MGRTKAIPQTRIGGPETEEGDLIGGVEIACHEDDEHEKADGG
jgi:hypothetical protein